MKLFDVFTGELLHFFKKPVVMITFVAVALIPILYCGFLIRGTWDPYGKLENLPIAVVNLDQGAILDGEPRNVGNEFVDELKKNNGFAWNFVSPDAAIYGMRNNHYYATITIPATFTANAASITSEQPHQAEIIYESNSFYNFVAGQISESATKELRNNLSKNLTEAYSRSIFAQFKTVSTGFGEAGKGAEKLHVGSQTISNGLSKVKANIGLLADGAQQLDNNIGLLQSGANKISIGAGALSGGAEKLVLGGNQLQTAAGALLNGAQKATDGSNVLLEGIQASKEGIDKLTAGLTSAVSGSEQLEAGLTTSTSASSSLTNGAAEITSGYNQLFSARPELESDPALKKLYASTKALAEGLKDFSGGQTKLLAGSQSITDGQQKLLAGSQVLSKGQQQLAQGASDLHTGQLQLQEGLSQYNIQLPPFITGIHSLGEGSTQLMQGAEELSGGTKRFAAGIHKVANGSKQLDSGVAQLNAGAVSLTEGSNQLALKLNAAAKETSAFKADDAVIQMLSNPVRISANDDRRVTLYANGIAPYFISLALFAGSLVFTTVYSARSSTVPDASRFRLLISKLLTFSIMSILQSLIVCTVLVFILGFKVQSIPLFYLFTVIVGLTFILLIQALVTWLDQPGRFLVLLIMIFQLASSAGTFPLELLPGWAKALHPWLPMTYSIIGFRDVISSGAFDDMWRQVGTLCIYIILSVILTSLYFVTHKQPTSEEQLMPLKV